MVGRNMQRVHNIPFINPVKEIHKKFSVLDEDIQSLFSPNEKTYNHLSGKGVNYMRQIYNDKIQEVLK